MLIVIQNSPTRMPSPRPPGREIATTGTASPARSRRRDHRANQELIRTWA
jgi:hypothetical protein